MATSRVEFRVVYGKGQDRVGGAIHHIKGSLPFRLLGLGSDNGGEFINRRLYRYCQRRGITFTRSRLYKKNDSAHVEQKNWSVVRRLIGYDRYNSREALAQLNVIYRLVGPYVNFFQPTIKLQGKPRHGAKVHKVYGAARTPYQLLLESGTLDQDPKDRLAQQYANTSPAKLMREIEEELEWLWALPTTKSQTIPVTPIWRQRA